jgi:S1-C subfamily serine protease
MYDWQMPFQVKNAGVSTGSGFFIDNKGHILTSAHVVRRSMEVEIEVASEGKKRYSAKVIGICFNADYDLALLKIQGYKPKFHFKLGQSDNIRSGDKVKAVGYPLASNQLKVTQGIVSGRENGLIQTDTALNPGNSGGPLLLEGSNKVIGINFQLLRGANAVGYAVPIQHFYMIKDEMIKAGNNRVIIRRPFMGFEYQNTNDESNQLDGVRCPKGGIRVNRVYPGSPMEKAGVGVGHVICSINGYQIDGHGQISIRPNELSPVDNVIHTIKNGKNSQIIFWDGTGMRRSVLPANNYQLAIRGRYPSYESVPFEVFGGIVVMELALNHIPLMKSRLFKYIHPKNRYTPKLVISKVLPGSDIFKQEVVSDGDILHKVNDRLVTNLKDLREALVSPIRRGTTYYMKIETEDNETVVMDLEQLIKNEEKMIEMFRYQPSEAYKKVRAHLERMHGIIQRVQQGGSYDYNVDQCLLL